MGEDVPLAGALESTCGELSIASRQIDYRVGQSKQHLIVAWDTMHAIMSHIHDNNILQEDFSFYIGVLTTSK